MGGGGGQLPPCHPPDAAPIFKHTLLLNTIAGAPSVVFTHSQLATNLQYGESKSGESGSEDKSTDSKVKGQSKDKLVEEEEKEEGVVKFGVYKSYWNAVGTLLALCVLFSFLLMQGNVCNGNFLTYLSFCSKMFIGIILMMIVLL